MPQLTPGVDDPNATARCPLRLFGSDDGPRCSALVLVRDAWEHERWHDALNDALQAPVEVQSSMEVTAWPEHVQPVDDVTPGRPGL